MASPHFPNPPRFRVSIAAALMVSFAGIVFTGVATVLAIVGWTATENTRSLLGDKATLTIGLMEAALRRLLDPVVDGNTYLAGLIQEGEVDPADSVRLAEHMRTTMAATPQVLGMGYLSPEMKITRVTRDPARIGVRVEDVSGDPEMRSAATRARAVKGPFWGPLVRNQREAVTLINLRRPLWRGETFIGVLVSVVTVSDLSRRIVLDGAAEGELVRFILYGDEHVLAHSSMIAGNYPRAADIPIPGITQVADPALPHMWDETARRELFVKLKGWTHGHVVRKDGQFYTFFYTRLNGYPNLPLTLGAYVRPNSALSDELRRLIVAGAAGLAALVIAVVVALLVARRLSRPVRNLATAAQLVGDMRLNEVPTLRRSRLRDLDEAATAFNVMVSGLRWFQTYVPRKLVRDLMAQGDMTDLVSEERDVTVMFTDIVGFTTVAERQSATETAALLNHHFSLLAACIEAEDGTVDKYIGDSVMAFWGPPLGGEDHAVRACRAASAIRQAVMADNAARGAAGETPIRLRIGLHTGPAIVGNIGAPGRMNYTLVGDTVNVTQRLEQLIKRMDPTEDEVRIVASADVAHAVRGVVSAEGIHLATCGVRELAGREGSMEVFALE